MSHDSLLDELTAGQPLAERLELACRATGVLGAALIVLSPQKRWSAYWGTDQQGLEFGPSTSAPAACISRPLLAALLAGLMRRRGVGLDEEIAAHLSGVHNKDFFAGISIRHLLSQTDGIGYRVLDAIPLDKRGCIDVAGLCEILSAYPRELPTGRAYSSSQGGYALLGALVEQWCEQPLAQALYEHLLDPLAFAAENRAVAVRPERICPTTGAGLELSAAELATFLEFQQFTASSRPMLFGGLDLSFLLERQVEYLGWSAGMTGSCLGWKSFAGGWIGQNGSGPDYTMLMRLHPERNTAVAFVCRGVLPLAYATLGRIFGTHMIEFNPPDGPRPLSLEECQALSAPRYTGTFGNRLHRIEIFRGAAGLEVRITQSRPDGARELGSGKLFPATRDIFFIPPPNTFGIWFVQHLSALDNGLDALWDGWHVWLRLTDNIQACAPR